MQCALKLFIKFDEHGIGSSCLLDSQDKEIAQNFYKGVKRGCKLKNRPKLNMSLVSCPCARFQLTYVQGFETCVVLLPTFFLLVFVFAFLLFILS
jgi:hypothetical protein